MQKVYDLVEKAVQIKKNYNKSLFGPPVTLPCTMKSFYFVHDFSYLITGGKLNHNTYKRSHTTLLK